MCACVCVFAFTFSLTRSRTQLLSGEKNVEIYAAYFTKQEEENFALFNYVNELSYEVEVLNEAVQRVQDDIGNHYYAVFQLVQFLNPHRIVVSGTGAAAFSLSFSEMLFFIIKRYLDCIP